MPVNQGRGDAHIHDDNSPRVEAADTTDLNGCIRTTYLQAKAPRTRGRRRLARPKEGSRENSNTVSALQWRVASEVAGTGDGDHGAAEKGGLIGEEEIEVHCHGGTAAKPSPSNRSDATAIP